MFSCVYRHYHVGLSYKDQAGDLWGENSCVIEVGSWCSALSRQRICVHTKSQHMNTLYLTPQQCAAINQWGVLTNPSTTRPPSPQLRHPEANQLGFLSQVNFECCFQKRFFFIFDKYCHTFYI